MGKTAHVNMEPINRQVLSMMDQGVCHHVQHIPGVPDEFTTVFASSDESCAKQNFDPENDVENEVQVPLGRHFYGVS